MGFRLQSALAGAATNLSSRLKALEEETNELVKTEAGRVAQDLKENRKARTAAKLDYGKAARKLQNYGLSDGQIEAVLAGGVEGATQFEQSLQSKATSAALAGKQFNQDAVIGELISQTNPEFAARDIAEQEEAYAAMFAPATVTPLGESVSTISAGIAGMAKGPAPTEYITSQLEAARQAAGGERPEEFTGRAFGTDTGFQFTPELVTPENLLELQKVQAETKRINAVTGLTTAQEEETRALFPGKVDLQGAELRRLHKGLELVDAQISNIFKDIDVSDANIKNIRARTALTLSQQYTEDQLRDLKEDELRAAIDQTRASIAFTESRTTELDKRNEYIDLDMRSTIDARDANTSLTVAKIASEGINAEKAQQDLNLSYEFGSQERQAKLDLLEAQVYNTNRPTDLEEYQTLILMENDSIRQKIAETDNETEKAELTELLKKNNKKITDSAKSLEGTQTGADLLNKGAASTVFNGYLRDNLQMLDIDLEYSDLGTVLSSLQDDKRPQFFSGVQAAIREFETVYGNDPQGASFVAVRKKSFNDAIKTFGSKAGQKISTEGKSGEQLKSAIEYNKKLDEQGGDIKVMPYKKLQEIDKAGTGVEGQVIGVPDTLYGIKYYIHTAGDWISI